MLILRWRAFSHMVEGTDAPRAVSREAGWMPIQMPLELGSCPPPLFSLREKKWKINVISFSRTHTEWAPDR